MLWFKQNARRWRMLILVLLAITFIGPWGYDRINVPAQYPCSLPNIRLEGDFCGLPLPGFWAVGVGFGAFFNTLATLFGNTSEASFVLLMRALFSISILLTPLPIFSSLFLLALGNHSWPQGHHIKIWGLAATGGLGFFLWVSLLQGLIPLQLWGIWAYVVLALVALLLEIGMLASNRRVDWREGVSG